LCDSDLRRTTKENPLRKNGGDFYYEKDMLSEDGAASQVGYHQPKNTFGKKEDKAYNAKTFEPHQQLIFFHRASIS
jgi:hypothetical protein